MSEAPAPPEVLAILHRVFPITSPLISLEFAKTPEGEEERYTFIVDEHALRVTVLLILWDEHSEERMVSSIKEQEVILSDQGVHTFPERLEAGLQAHAEVLRRLFEREDCDHERYLPNDLFFPEIFTLKTARTIEDFVRALSVKSRLDVTTPCPPETHE